MSQKLLEEEKVRVVRLEVPAKEKIVSHTGYRVKLSLETQVQI